METSKRWALVALVLVGTVQITMAEEVTTGSETRVESAVLDPDPEFYYQREVETIITAYSSREEETDSTPFITASGTRVRPGIVAANWLPIGTNIRIPEIFGDQVFIVEDRMHRRNSGKVDIWFPTTEEAVEFGVKTAKVQIL